MKKSNILKLLMIIFIIIIFELYSYSIFFQMIETVSVKFNREYKDKNKIEITKGDIYYESMFKKVVIKVDYPINQWMILKGNETIIYYPNELKAFRIISQNPVSIPFFQAFIQVIKEDYGLSDFGYTFTSFTKEKNILVSYWHPPNYLSKFLGKFTLKFEDNKIIYVEIENANGEVLSEAYFKNHVLYGATYFPLEITIVKNARINSIVEKIIYKNPQFNSPIPQEVNSFKIPDGVKVKELRW